MHLIVNWTAYPMDEKGVKRRLLGIAKIEMTDQQTGTHLKDVVRIQVTQKYPELKSTPILLSSFGFQDGETSYDYQ